MVASFIIFDDKTIMQTHWTATNVVVSAAVAAAAVAEEDKQFCRFVEQHENQY